MNQEKLKFIRAEPTAQVGDDFVAEIHVVGEEVWLGRICIFGSTERDADDLRERLLWALEQPTAPEVFQVLREYKTYEGEPCGTYWTNLDNGGEAAKLKGEGYQIRALYLKQPLS